MSFSVSIRPPNLSKKARPPPRDIPAASMNCQIIFIPYLTNVRLRHAVGRFCAFQKFFQKLLFPFGSF